MAIAIVFEGLGVTRAQYDQVLKDVSPDNRPPTGMPYHVAGPTEGGWRVVEVWESREAAQRFFEETLRQALQKANTVATPTFFQVHNIMQAS
jgi:quinol monooxygenase YgiN